VAELYVGATLGPCALTVDEEVVAGYADAAADHNPIHFNDAAAHQLGLPGRIAHGMISGALLGRLLAAELGAPWLQRGRLELKFVRPVALGATVTARGTVRSLRPLTIEVTVETAPDALVIVGTAVLTDLPQVTGGTR